MIIIAGIILVILAGAATFIWLEFGADRRPKFPKLPRQDEVVEAIWHGVMNVPRFCWWKPTTWKNRAPAVDWVRGDRLNWKSKAWGITWDEDGAGPIPPHTMHVAGLTVRKDFIMVAYPEGTTSYHTTALAHELTHAYLILTKGDGNAAHTAPEFQAGGLESKAEDKVLELKA